MQKGDIIDVLSMNASGVWKGSINGKVGYLKSMHIEVIQESEAKGVKKVERNTRKACPTTVDELLSRIGLKEYTSVFVLNG
jgi:SAM and SH3 domain-containing protein 1